MELRFLGQVYSASDSQVPTVKLDRKAHFLGKTYYLRRPVRTFRSQIGLRKYRGISYGD